MSGSDIVYREGSANVDVVCSHLEAVDGRFHPPLSTRIVIRDYAEKIVSNSRTFEAWSGSDLVGLVAAYLNDPSLLDVFVTSVSASIEGAGIATKLMKMLVSHARAEGFSTISLDVSRASDQAVSLYRKLGFVEIRSPGVELRLQLALRTRDSTGLVDEVK